MVAYILCGLPGSGKSTWTSKKIQGECNIAVVSRDDIRSMVRTKYDLYEFCPEWEGLVHEIAVSACRSIVNRRIDIIVDETNVKKSYRKAWVDVIKRENPDYKVVFVYFSETKNNLENRMKSPKYLDKGIWSDVIERMKNSFEPIEDGEPFDELEIFSI